jgi:branched-chain amino acid transport system substrate-binding protein
MASGLLARSRALIALGASVAIGATLAGCAATSNSSVTASGKTLTIYASVPAQSADPQAAADVYDAELLALQQSSGVGTFKLRIVKLTANKLSDNGRTAIKDQSAVAYLGELDPGTSGDTIGITNALDLLQVTPTDTALELTQASAADPSSPDKYYESLGSYGRTFARVCGSSAQEAKAQVQEMQSLGVKQLYIRNDGTPYGAAIALAVKQDAPSAGITVVNSLSGADGYFYGAGASGAASASSALADAAKSNSAIKLFVPSALDTSAFASSFGPANISLYASAPGVMSGDQPFISQFKQAYGHAPAQQAVFGYVAMSAVLKALDEAGASANNRTTVVHDFFTLKNFSSPVGALSFNGDGNPSVAPFVISRLRNGALVPVKQVQG